MQDAKEEFKDLIERFIALQFIFDKQWRAVKVSRPAAMDLHPAQLKVYVPGVCSASQQQHTPCTFCVMTPDTFDRAVAHPREGAAAYAR